MSKLYDALQNINKGRLNIIKSAELLGKPIDEKASLDTVANSLLDISNTQYTDPLFDGAWHRPTEWPDSKSILLNAEDRDGLHPVYIMLFDNNCNPTITFSSSTKQHCKLRGDAYLMSDGTWITDVSGEITHTWDTTKDLPGGYKWMIIYMANNTNVNNLDIFYGYMECIEIIVGNISGTNTGFRISESSGVSIVDAAIPRNLVNYEHTEYTHLSDIRATSFSLSQYHLEHMYLPNVTDINNWWGRPSLIEFEAPDLERWGTPNTNPFFGLTDAYLIKLPKLKYINTLENDVDRVPSSSCNFIDNGYHLKRLDLPNLEYAGLGTRLIEGGINLEYINLPKLKSIGSIGYTPKIHEVYLPELVKINGLDYTYSSTNYNVYSSISNYTMPNLVSTATSSANIGPVNSIELADNYTGSLAYLFYSIRRPISFIFKETWTITSVSRMFSYAYGVYYVGTYPNFELELQLNDTNLTRNCLLEMLNNLIDLTGATAKTLTLGVTNLAKLTDAEKLIATNKNWILA